MATGVNVKMGVSGVAQFKQNITTAKNSLKTLDAQLALNEKQFKQTGDAETYMQQKSELLKVKLEEQKSVVANAEKALDQMTKNGVDKASKAFQDMQQQLLRAKGDLIDTENAMNGVDQAGNDAADGVSSMNNQLKRVGEGISFQNVTQGIGKITDGLEGAARKAMNLGRRIFDAMMGAGSYADDLKTRASKYGLSTEELQRMDKTATLIDTDVDAIINAQKKLRKGIGSRDEGVMGAFAALFGNGYDPKAKGWENAFWDAGEAIMKFADEEEKEVYAQKLFGRSWNELIPLFEAGRKEYEETNASWKVLSEEQIDSLGRMDDEYQKLQQNWETLKQTALAEFAEPMASALETISAKLGEFTEWLESDEGKAMVDSVVGKVKEALEWIADPANIQSVIHGLELIVAGWAGLKLTGGALTVMQFISGLKGLTGGGAGAAGAGAAGAGGIGGKLAGTAAGSWLSSVLPQVSSFISYNGGPVVDWLTHDSPIAGLLSGRESLGEFWQRMTDKFSEESIQAFQDNWDPNNPNANVLAKLVGKTTGNLQAAGEWTFGDDFTAEDAAQLAQAADKMDEAAEDLSGGSSAQRQSSTEMTQAAGEMKGLPAAVRSAVVEGMSHVSIYMDGQQVGYVVEPYVSAGMGGRVLMVTK